MCPNTFHTISCLGRHTKTKQNTPHLFPNYNKNPKTPRLSLCQPQTHVVPTYISLPSYINNKHTPRLVLHINTKSLET